jgi:ABC-type branched-subunit amino acid transport system ATPase component
MTLLAVRDLTVAFGGNKAVDAVDLDVEDGEIVGLIGPNGAGKTTLFEAVAGFTAPDDGTITFDGTDVTAMAPERRASLGLIRSFQDAKLFSCLTVFQTMLVSLEKGEPSRLWSSMLPLPPVRARERRKEERADELIAQVGLEPYRDKLASELSTGTRRILELACCVALEPRLLLLDEPSSGIAQREVEALGTLLRRIADVTGCTMLVIEHDMPLVMGLAKRIVALESGRVIAEGTPKAIAKNPTVIASYLGTTDVVINRSGTTRKKKPVRRRSTAKEKRPARKVRR